MRVLSDLLDLVLPADCLCCGRSGAAWCAACQPASVPRRIEHPGAPVTFAAGEYAEQLRTILIAYKERGRRQLAGQLAGYLADAVDCAVRAPAGPVGSLLTDGTAGPVLVDGPAGPVPIDGPVLIPVPSSRPAARARGGDHILRLARTVARQTGLPMLQALSLTGPTADSAGLSAEQRRANLAGRMAAVAPSGVRRAILVDDIITTGATLAEADRALTAAGWPAAGAAVIAATRLRRNPGTPAGGPGARAPPHHPRVAEAVGHARCRRAAVI